MIETKDIKKMTAHIIRRDKGAKDVQIMHPNREWFTGLAIATLIVALGTWFSFYLYWSYTDEMSKEVVVTESILPYNAAAVKSALEIFAQKQKKFNEILVGDNTKITSVKEVETDKEVLATSTTEIPEMIIDPPPVYEDDKLPEATLAP